VLQATAASKAFTYCPLTNRNLGLDLEIHYSCGLKNTTFHHALSEGKETTYNIDKHISISPSVFKSRTKRSELTRQFQNLEVVQVDFFFF